MQGDLTQRVLRAIERHGMFRPGDRVGVAVSGGADSVALLRLLEELSGPLGLRLIVLHFNHQLRGADSDADERFVTALATERGLEIFAERGDVAAVARERKWNLEDAARRMRYAFFRAVAARAHLVRVAVAHTADDQAETVLARLVRGTGPAGLAAIYPVKGRVVRPLLAIRRSELRSYLEKIGQRWREDLSNWDMQRLRARLRHDVLPALERDLQPAIVSHLCRLAELSREDEAFWAALAVERMTALARHEHGRIGIRCADLIAPLAMSGAHVSSEAQVALSRRLVRAILLELRGGSQQLTAQHVAQVLHLAATQSGAHRTELPGAIVERSLDWIWFERVEDGKAKSEARTSAQPRARSAAATPRKSAIALSETAKARSQK